MSKRLGGRQKDTMDLDITRLFLIGFGTGLEYRRKYDYYWYCHIISHQASYRLTRKATKFTVISDHHQVNLRVTAIRRD